MSHFCDIRVAFLRHLDLLLISHLCDFSRFLMSHFCAIRRLFLTSHSCDIWSASLARLQGGMPEEPTEGRLTSPAPYSLQKLRFHQFFEPPTDGGDVHPHF